MSRSLLEDRLRDAMGTSSRATRSTSLPDPQILDEIRQRAQTSRRSQVNDSGFELEQLRLISAAAVFGIVAATAGFLVVSRRNLNSTNSDPGSQLGPAEWPQPPSWWWVFLLLCVMAAAVATIRRLFDDALLTAAAGCAAVGLVGAAALLWPQFHRGAELAEMAPTIEGYELVDVSLVKWPDRIDNSVAELTYRRDPLASTAPPVDLDDIAEEIWFTERRPDPSGYLLDSRCLRVVDTLDPQGHWEGHSYCLDSGANGELDITALSHRNPMPVDPRIVAYPLWMLALIFLVVHRVGRGGENWLQQSTPRRRIAFGVSIFFFSAALFLVGLPAYDLARVDAVVGETPCDSWIGACRDQLAQMVVENGVIHSARRIYGPVVIMGDFLAAVLVALGWILAAISGFVHGGRSGKRRAKWLIALTVVVFAVAIAGPATFGETLEKMTNLNE